MDLPPGATWRTCEGCDGYGKGYAQGVKNTREDVEAWREMARRLAAQIEDHAYDRALLDEYDRMSAATLLKG